MSNLLKAFTSVVVAAGALFWAVSAASQESGRVTWSPELHLQNIADIPRQLRQPILTGSERLTLAKGGESRSIGNCEEYLAAVGAGFFPDTNYAEKRSGEFVSRCFVLRDLEHARPATSGSFYRWSNASLKELPPVMVVGSREVTGAASAAERRGESWQKFNPALKVTELKDDLLMAEDAGYAYTMEILARGDFNGDGVEDIAVYGTATGKHGTWSDAEYFIFSRTPAGKFVRLTSEKKPYSLVKRATSVK